MSIAMCAGEGLVPDQNRKTARMANSDQQIISSAIATENDELYARIQTNIRATRSRPDAAPAPGRRTKNQAQGGSPPQLRGL